MLGTRTARGTHATADALRTVRAESYAQIRVCPQRIEPNSSLGLMATAQRHLRQLLARAGLVRQQDEQGGKGADAFKALSASWWLSAPVQQYLNQQLEAEHNDHEIKRVAKVLAAR